MKDIKASDDNGNANSIDGRRDGSEYLPDHYRGTNTDHDDMRAMGNTQMLRRNFNTFTLIGFANTVMVLWEVFLVSSALGLSVAGKAPVFWGLFYGACTTPCIYLTIAELAAIAPTSAGQFHWVSELSPPSIRTYLSYITGWLVSLGWLSFLTLVSYVGATTIQGIAILNYPTYLPLRWHATLLTCAIVVFGFICNVLLAGYLPVLELIFFALHIVGWTAIWITLASLAPLDTAHNTLVTVDDYAGWNTVGLATIISMSSSVALFVGYEAPVHLAEETRNASKAMPRVILWTVLMNIVMVLIMAGVYLAAIGDIISVLTTRTYTPFIQVFFDATQSVPGTSTMVSIVIIELIAESMSTMTSASRQIWSFARDGGLPFSPALASTSKRLNIPLGALAATVMMVILICLINIGSVTALNALNALGTISILSSYLIVLGSYMWYRCTHDRPPRGSWSRFGMVYAVIGFVAVLPIWVFLMWPLSNHPDATTMNWASTMWGGVIILASVWYAIYERKTYTPPVDKVKQH